MVDHKNTDLSASDLLSILEVNRKTVEIHLEVEKQNEQVLSMLKEMKEASGKMEEKMEELDRGLFRLMVILSSAGAGTLLTLLQQFMHH